MRLVLRMRKRGMGTELFIVIILGLVFAVITLNAAGKLQTAAETKDYGDTMCRAALANEDMLFNNSMEQSLKTATAGVIGAAAGWQTAKLIGQIGSVVAQTIAVPGSGLEVGAGKWLMKTAKVIKTVEKAETAVGGEKAFGTIKGATGTVKVIETSLSTGKTIAKDGVVPATEIIAKDSIIITGKTAEGDTIVQVIDMASKTIKAYSKGGLLAAPVELTTKQQYLIKAWKTGVIMKKWGRFASTWAKRAEYPAGVIWGYYVYGKTRQAIDLSEAVAQSGLTSSCGIYIKDTQVGYTQDMAALITNFTAYACDMGQFEEKSTATMVRLSGGVLTNDTNKVTFEMIQALYHGSENDYYHRTENENDSKYLNSCALIWRVGGTSLHCNDVSTISVNDADELEMSTGANVTSEAAMPLKISYCHRKKLLPGTEHFVEIEDYRE